MMERTLVSFDWALKRLLRDHNVTNVTYNSFTSRINWFLVSGKSIEWIDKWIEGYIEGFSEGRVEGVYAIVKKMKDKGKSYKEIAELTDLSEEDIKKL